MRKAVVTMLCGLALTVMIGVAYAADWQAEIQVVRDVTGYTGVDNVQIGNAGAAATLPKAPAPPSYSARIVIYQDLTGFAELQKDIKTPPSAGETQMWFLAIDPRGNQAPPISQTATVNWDAGQLDAEGTYHFLKIDFAGNVTGTLIEDMLTTTQIQVSGSGVDAYAISYAPGAPQPNQPPVADAGPDQEAVLGEGETSASVLLDGRGSSDPDGSIVVYAWTEGATSLGTGDTLRVDLEAGVHPITLTVTDDGDSTDTDEVVVTVLPSSVEVQVSVPDTSAAPGDTLWIPVRVSDVTGKGVVSFRIVLTYSSNVLAPISASTANTIAEVLDSVAVNLGIQDTLAVGVAGTEDHPLSGTGSLLLLQFEVVGGCGDTTPLHLAEVLFNEGIPPAVTADGTFEVVCGRISGAVRYYSDDTPIAGVDMLLSGTGSATVVTGEHGLYQFDNLDAGTYAVCPTKDADPPEPAVSAYDASLALRHSVWLDTLNAEQFIAGDVTGNEDITPYDAALILSYVVGLRTEFPAGAWVFLPDSVQVDVPPGTAGASFTGILVGDPSGDYGVGSAPRIVVGDLRKVCLKESLRGSAVRIEDARDVLAGEMVVTFDPEQVEVTEVVPGALTSGCLFAYGIEEGTIRMAFAGSDALSGGGDLAEIGFHRRVGTEASEVRALDLGHVRLNEGRIGVAIHSEGRSDPDTPRRYALLQNHPNPFNTETVIRYALSEERVICLCIYDVQGQRVRTLVQGVRGPARYVAVWDGMDEEGRIVATGMYLYRLEWGTGELTRKMMLIR